MFVIRESSLRVRYEYSWTGLSLSDSCTSTGGAAATPLIASPVEEESGGMANLCRQEISDVGIGLKGWKSPVDRDVVSRCGAGLIGVFIWRIN